MLTIKYKTISNSKVKSFKFNLFNNFDISGFSEMNNIILSGKTEENINITNDNDKVMFTSSLLNNFIFNFINDAGVSGNTYINAGFTEDELSTTLFTKSFFYFDIYDRINNNNSVKLDTCYIYPTDNNIVSDISIPSKGVDSNIFIPNYFINNITGNSLTLYFRLFFFNAKVGKIHIFNNFNNRFNIDESRFFFELTINLDTYLYTINGSSNIITFESKNTSYLDKYNANNNDSQPIKKANFTSGTIFKIDGTYE